MTPTTKNKTENMLPSFISDLFDSDKFFGNRWFEREFSATLPAVNVIENGKEFQIEFAAPGFSKSDFRVSVENNVLSVSAEKREEKSKEDERFTRREFAYNSFSRSFTLPQSVNADKIEAKYNDGILSLHVAKKEGHRSDAKKEIRIS
jgi:HSP20 family protein